MANSFRELYPEERRILERNSVDPKWVSVIHRSDTTLVVRHHKTGDDIIISQGCRPWSRYDNPK